MTEDSPVGFGTDKTDGIETLARAERMPDGSVRFEVVQILDDEENERD